MENKFIVGIASFLTGVIISRIIIEKAMKTLSQEEKARLIDGFTGTRTYGFIPVLVAILIFIGLNRYSDFNKQTILYAYTVLLSFVIVGMQIFVIRKLTKLEFPKSYIKKYNFSRVIYFLGLGGFIWSLFVKYN